MLQQNFRLEIFTWYQSVIDQSGGSEAQEENFAIQREQQAEILLCCAVPSQAVQIVGQGFDFQLQGGRKFNLPRTVIPIGRGSRATQIFAEQIPWCGETSSANEGFIILQQKLRITICLPLTGKAPTNIFLFTKTI